MSGVDGLEEASYSFPERVMMVICRYTPHLYIVVVLEMTLLLFATLSALFTDLDQATRTILLLDFIILGTVTASTVILLFLCERRIRGEIYEE